MKALSTRYVSGLCAAVILSLSSGCSSSNEWTVDGTIEGAEGETMVLEASSNGRWYPLESVELTGGGNFSIKHEAVGYPDIYRLRLGDKTLYFPIDSIETVTVVSKVDAFDTDYTLAGSPSAELLMDVDRRVMELVKKGGATAIAGDSLLKRELGTMLMDDPANIVAYYIINKKVGGVSIFNPANKRDLGIIGAVANAFGEKRPNDPRTKYLRSLFLSNRFSGERMPLDTIVAEEIKIFDIDRYDNLGNRQVLSEAVNKNKVVVLNFTAYGAEASPALNIELNRLYQKYRNSGLEIYQIGFDEDEYAWRQAAKNLPWITVYNSPTDGSRALMEYNVTKFPTAFVIANGELTDRVEDFSKLESLISKRL